MRSAKGLDRFRQAQDAPGAGFAEALRELLAGQKTSHWIWYIFPQLAGLGRSSTATYYGLAGADEAAAYLRDPVLGARLIQAAAVVRAHLARPNPVRLEVLMGSSLDALKLVSCMTLFGRVARTLEGREKRPEFATMAEHAEAILRLAAAQGHARCVLTDNALRGQTE